MKTICAQPRGMRRSSCSTVSCWKKNETYCKAVFPEGYLCYLPFWGGAGWALSPFIRLGDAERGTPPPAGSQALRVTEGNHWPSLAWVPASHWSCLAWMSHDNWGVAGAGPWRLKGRLHLASLPGQTEAGEESVAHAATGSTTQWGMRTFRALSSNTSYVHVI